MTTPDKPKQESMLLSERVSSSASPERRETEDLAVEDEIQPKDLTKIEEF